MKENETKPLIDKVVVVGVTGSIAAYKAADVVSQLVKWGANVHVIMTDSATKFVQPLTFQTLSRNPVYTSMWDDVSARDWEPGHISLADRADLLLVAPATAQTMANFANGQAPDLLCNTYLATLAPVVIAPAMNSKMLDHPATQRNIEVLSERGNKILDTQYGLLACGYEGQGKLATPEVISHAVRESISGA